MTSPRSIFSIEENVCYNDEFDLPTPPPTEGVCELEPPEHWTPEKQKTYEKITCVEPQCPSGRLWSPTKANTSKPGDVFPSLTPNGSGVFDLADLFSCFLGSPAFAGSVNAIDRDSDNIADNLEEWLSRTYSPVLRFDEEEAYAPSIRILWQVHPIGCMGQDCSSPMRVALTYVFLYEKDGGRWCHGVTVGNHCGDNEAITLYLDLYNNATEVQARFNKAFFNQHKGGSWYDALEWYGSRPIVYVSEDKHASYASKSACEGGGSLIISGLTDIGGCWEEDCGEGPLFTDLVGPTDNVGEASHQLLGRLGGVFTIEEAWGRRDFCGGFTPESCGHHCGASNYSKWDFSSYTKSGNPLTLDGRKSSGRLEFVVNSRDPSTLWFAFRARSRDAAWPGEGKAYTIPYNGNVTQSLACEPGESICWGAWDYVPGPGDTNYVGRRWGAGYMAQEDCSYDYCLPCDGSTQTLNITVR